MIARRPRIAFLLSSLKFGGGERVALNLGRALQHQGYDIDFVLMSCEGELLEEAERTFTIIDLNCARTWRLPTKLAGYLRKAKPAGLISSFWKLNVCASLARIAAPRTRLALWEHSPPSLSGNSPLWAYGPTASLLYRMATKVVAVSDGVAADIRRHTLGLGEKVVVIPNPVFAPRDAHAMRKSSGDPTILWIGRFADPKNPALMLRAFARLRPRTNATLQFLGDGPLRMQVEAEAASLGMGDSVAFLGFRPDPFFYMARAAILVVTSDREGLPTVLIEALFAGLPCVSTDCGSGAREILGSGSYGSIVPIGNAQALSEAIERELKHPRDPDQQREAARRFDPDHIAQCFTRHMKLGRTPRRY